MVNLKECSSCGKVLPELNFHKDKTHSDGLKSSCKSCRKKENPNRRIYANNYYAKNSEVIKAKAVNSYRIDPALKSYRLAWNSKRRALIKGSSSEIVLDSTVIEAYGTICYLCNSDIDMQAPRKPGTTGWESGLHIEHVIPISKGGPNILENMRPSHGSCNLKKGVSLI